MNLLVTGGLGYLGSEILWKAAGHDPGAQLVSMGRSPLPDGLHLPPGTAHETGSVMDESRILELLRRFRITHVIHTAGPRTSACASNPLEAIENNVLGTRAVMNAIGSHSLTQTMLFLSTAAVYGGADAPLDEGSPIAPPTPYAVSKAAAEMVVSGCAARLRVRHVIVRPGFVMGVPTSGAPSRSRLDAHVRKALAERTAGFRFARRFFVHALDELAEGIVQLAGREDAEGIFHLPGCATSLEELGSVLGQIANAPVETTVDETASLPAHLDATRFDRLFGPSRPPGLATLVLQSAGSMRDKVEGA